MADPVEGTITALPPLIGSLSNGMLFETANSGVSQSVTAQQIAAFAAGPDGSVPSSRIIATPDSGGLSGGGTLASDLSLSMAPNALTAKTTPVAADAVVINDSSGNTPAKTTLSDFYKSIAGLTQQVAPVSTTYSMALYNSGDGNAYQSTLQDALASAGTLPTGGTTGQVLVKTSNADFATGWSGSAGTVTSVTVSPGTGLSGGGTITTSGTVTLTLANTAVTPTSYGSSSASPTFTVDAQGRLTAASNVTITPTAIGAVPTTRTITAGTGLTGGGDLSANRTLAIDVTGVSASTYGDSTHVAQVAVNTQGQITSASSVAISLASLGAVPTSRTLTAGTGLTGGGTLAADRTFTLADTAVTPGSYGTASTVGTFTVDQQGRLTAATPTTITPAAIGAVPTTRAVNTATGLTGGGALSADLTINYNITALANKASPSGVSDLVLIWDASASAYKNATVGSIGSAGTVSSFNSRTGAVVPAAGDYSLAQLAATTGSRIVATNASGISGASAITFASSNAGFPGVVTIASSAASTSTSTGALQIAGGLTAGPGNFIQGGSNNSGTTFTINERTRNDSDTSFLVAAQTSNDDFAVKTNGNVGIGTTTPNPIGTSLFGKTLTVTNTTVGSRAVIELWTNATPSASNGGIAGQINFLNGSSPSVPSAAILSQYNGTTSGTGDLAFFTSSTAGGLAQRLTILPAGNVGIGTSSPAQPLDVNGWVNVNGQITGSSLASGSPLPYVSVKVFGVVGDGSTDDTAAFQAAIDAMAASPGAGGVLLVPPGNYFVPGGLTLKQGVQIYGSGHQQGSAIYNRDTATVITFDSTCFYAGISNCGVFIIDSPTPTNNVVHCVGLGNVIRDCNLLGGHAALFIEGTDCIIENCVITGYNYCVFSTSANWYIRNKLDQGDGSYTATAAFRQDASGANQVQENHFLQCDFTGFFTHSFEINDTAFGQALTVFEGCVFSQPMTIDHAVWTCLSACEVGGNIALNASTGGKLTVIGSYGFTGVSITGGSSQIVNTGNFNIT